MADVFIRGRRERFEPQQGLAWGEKKRREDLKRPEIGGDPKVWGQKKTKKPTGFPPGRNPSQNHGLIWVHLSLPSYTARANLSHVFAGPQGFQIPSSSLVNLWIVHSAHCKETWQNRGMGLRLHCLVRAFGTPRLEVSRGARCVERGVALPRPLQGCHSPSHLHVFASRPHYLMPIAAV